MMLIVPGKLASLLVEDNYLPEIRTFSDRFKLASLNRFENYLSIEGLMLSL